MEESGMSATVQAGLFDVEQALARATERDEPATYPF